MFNLNKNQRQLIRQFSSDEAVVVKITKLIQEVMAFQSANDPTHNALFTLGLADLKAQLTPILKLLPGFMYAVRIMPDLRSETLWVVNDAAQITDYHAADAPSTPEDWQRLIYEPDVPIFRKRLASMMTGGDVVSEYRIIRQSGDLVWVRDYGHATFQPDQTIIVIGLAHDVTEQKRAEQALRLALTREKELNQARSQLISMASHELRSPLASIKMSLSMIERYEEEFDKDQRAQRFQQLYSTIEQMDELIDEVLFLGRNEAGKLTFQPTTLNLGSLCRRMIDNFRSIVSATHKIIFDNDVVMDTIQADKKLIQQVVSNLLTNAIKYSPDGGAVRLHLDDLGDQLQLTVADEGVGIPEDAQQQVFEPFYRAGNVGDVGGTGLGLYITRSVVELHGGQITFESSVGQGTTFIVTLPKSA